MNKKFFQIIIFIIIVVAVIFSFFSMDKNLDKVEEKVEQINKASQSNPFLAAKAIRDELKKPLPEKMSADEVDQLIDKYKSQILR
ncbi:MAG TPA: hypothetical protein PLD27_02020 [bacterium]|nr:hypothetical protein [bacterium]HOL46679.1 hypothetical protein [bacterium]HPQ18367.1 hypothetical protein [bacterium]